MGGRQTLPLRSERPPIPTLPHKGGGGHRRLSLALSPPRPIAGLIAKVGRVAFARKGFAAAEIITRWPAVVGETVAAHAIPERLVFPPGMRSEGVLHVAVAPGGFATHLQHLEPQVLERINGFFGYRAVVRLRLVQRPLAARTPIRKRPAAPPLSRQAEAHLHKLTAETRDERLKTALDGLGREILSRPPKP